jgi:predicted nucleotidyltransferase
MKTWPEYNDSGDLPPGIHKATLIEVIDKFGKGSSKRSILAERLQRIFKLVIETGHIYRFIIFGSFVTSKRNPEDIDIFLLMDNDFDVSQVTGEAKILFDHVASENYEGASIFWLRLISVLDGEEKTVNYWQLKRDGNKRGIVEVLIDDK